MRLQNMEISYCPQQGVFTGIIGKRKKAYTSTQTIYNNILSIPTAYETPCYIHRPRSHAYTTLCR